MLNYTVNDNAIIALNFIVLYVFGVTYLFDITKEGVWVCDMMLRQPCYPRPHGGVVTLDGQVTFVDGHLALWGE